MAAILTPKSYSTRGYRVEWCRAGGSRTHMVSPPMDFKSTASAFSPPPQMVVASMDMIPEISDACK